MTTADDLMALAVAWESDAVFDAQHGQLASAATFEQCAADLRALLDSDAFRAMVRNDARYRWLRDDAPTGIGEMASVRDYHTPAEMDEAIDAAASGAGEG